MKDQYVGVINDYRKYALVRRLQVKSGLRLGVCWMLTPDDGRTDGGKIKYLEQSRHEAHDPELYALLRRIINAPDGRRLMAIEAGGILPGKLTADRVSVVSDNNPFASNDYSNGNLNELAIGVGSKGVKSMRRSIGCLHTGVL